MPVSIDLQKWKPIGVKNLEPTALDIVRSESNTAVIAGPGAGKTELLAQRACYLLQTGLCEFPKRILAISFKKDAAKNLRDRVASRSDKEQSMRFDSYTFDALSKSLLDRFIFALPPTWRPTSDYEIYSPTGRKKKNEFNQFLYKMKQSAPISLLQAEMDNVTVDNFEKDFILGCLLPINGIVETGLGSWAAAE